MAAAVVEILAEVHLLLRSAASADFDLVLELPSTAAFVWEVRSSATSS